MQCCEQPGTVARAVCALVLQEVPQSLQAATACQHLDLSNWPSRPGRLDVSSLVVFFAMTSLKRWRTTPLTFDAVCVPA